MRQLFRGKFFSAARLLCFMVVKLTLLLFALLLIELGKYIDHLAALVPAAISADRMALTGGTTMRTEGKCLYLEFVMGTDAVPLPFGVLHSDDHTRPKVSENPVLGKVYKETGTRRTTRPGRSE